MSSDIISPDYNWKQAATQEGVDYDAVQKSFMDQSYGVVANKAKILFQDPFRLGFEIVHRNEKATKMVGIFAFRVNKKLLYAPTFFVNGEIKPADMLYRADVKRFVPLTEDWCAWLVRGVEERSGEVVDKSRFRQNDAYMDRLAYPQRVKYASDEDFILSKAATELAHEEMHARWHKEMKECQEKGRRGDHGFDQVELEKLAAFKEEMPEGWEAEMREARDVFVKAAQDGSLWAEMMRHCADASPIKKILPEVINELGPVALEKVASMVGTSDVVGRFLAKNYTREELETVDGWMAKEASPEVLPAITLISDPRLAKSATERDAIFDKGYTLIDDRPPETLNTVVEEVGDGTVKELSSPGKACILLDDGSLKEVYLFREDCDILNTDDMPTYEHSEKPHGKPEFVYCPDSKQLLKLKYGQEIFGDEMIDQELPSGCCTADQLKTGKSYVAVSKETEGVSRPIHVLSKDTNGECTTISYCGRWGDECKMHYAPGRSEAQGRYISDETLFLEVECDVERREDGSIRDLDCKCDIVPISPSGIDDWIRTAGGVTSSRDVTVKPSKNGLTFDIEHKEEGGTILKSARDLGWLEAHLSLAEDFSMTLDQAGTILDKAQDKDVTYRVFDSALEKVAYLTRPEGMEEWIQSYDPELQVRMDAPQKQVLSTHTPRRPDQVQRYGDTHQRVPAENKQTDEDLLPMDAVMNSSPEELAQMSEMYEMPHIFDHSCVGQMATTTHNVIDQIKKYVPDLETGVDRYFRILFLLRYRPADFEEHYGKDDLVEFEQDLTDLAAQSGEHLLRILQRFEPKQYAAQDN